MLSSDALCGCSILLRFAQILLAVALFSTIFAQSNKNSLITGLITYYVPLLAAVCSVLFYGLLLVRRVLVHFSPIVVLTLELISCLLWKTTFVTSSYDFANKKPRSFSSWLAVTTVGCSFSGFALSACAVILLLCCGSIRHASKLNQWNRRDYFLLGGIFHRSCSEDVCYEKQQTDEEWAEKGKPHAVYGNDGDAYSMSHVSLDRKVLVEIVQKVLVEIYQKVLMEKEETDAESIVSEDYNLDASFSSDCQSTSSYASLASSEVSTMKGDNSSIQGIPFADGENDDGGGDGWRRCSSTANASFPRFYEE